MGFTKHMGGLKATRELIELCHTNKDKYVLDVGCGVGITACNIVKRYSCKVVGVDISEEMIARSNERAKMKEMAKEARGTPKNLLEYWGYGIYVGRK